MIGSKFIEIYEVTAKAVAGEIDPVSGAPIEEGQNTLWWAKPFGQKDDPKTKILLCATSGEIERANREAEEYMKRHGWETYKMSELCQRFVKQLPGDNRKSFTLAELLLGLGNKEDE